MSESEPSQKISTFLSSGIYRFTNSTAVFIDPVRVLNRSYTRFRISPSTYYSRFFDAKHSVQQPRVSSNSRRRKRKRKGKEPYSLNVRELAANQRHQEARHFLVKAHESLLGATDLLSVMSKLRIDECVAKTECEELLSTCVDEQSFLELGRLWQAPMFEITLNFNPRFTTAPESAGSPLVQNQESRAVPIFDKLVVNETSDDVEAEFLSRQYILPRESCFYMSDMAQIHQLIPGNILITANRVNLFFHPANPDSGFNLIVVDPPWENRSAHQKSMYPTLPNRYFLSLPIKHLSHAKGALVALWVTNKEKLRNFVEKELFPKWEVSHFATFFWLKVKSDGSLISELDLFHHRPYECLLLGYCHGEVLDSTYMSRFGHVQDNQVIISIPGDYSRKPPIGEWLLDYVPALKPARCVELFAREMMPGWTSWGNEPLHFQDSKYFMRMSTAK